MIEDEKLWCIMVRHQTRACPKVECVMREEAVQLARTEHNKNGHWQQDSIKKALIDCIWSPGLDASIIKGIMDCGICKNFGGTHLNLLLDLITRRHPLELLVGDYLSLPTGKGGYHIVGLYLDIFGFKYKTADSKRTTKEVLDHIFQEFGPWEMFMTNGGKHFVNKEVHELCDK